MCHLLARIGQRPHFGVRHAGAAQRVQPREVLPLPLPANGTELPNAHRASAMETTKRFTGSHAIPLHRSIRDRCGTGGTLL